MPLFYIGSTLTLLALGFWWGDSLLKSAFSQLDPYSTVSAHSMTAQLNQLLIVSLAFGLLPLLYFLTKKLANIESTKQSVIVSLIIILTGITLWQLKLMTVNMYLNSASKSLADKGISNSVDIGQLNLGLYLALGFIFGSILCMLIYRTSNKKNID